MSKGTKLRSVENKCVLCVEGFYVALLRKVGCVV